MVRPWISGLGQSPEEQELERIRSELADVNTQIANLVQRGVRQPGEVTPVVAGGIMAADLRRKAQEEAAMAPVSPFMRYGWIVPVAIGGLLILFVVKAIRKRR